jgi:hypothetical protein
MIPAINIRRLVAASSARRVLVVMAALGFMVGAGTTELRAGSPPTRHQGHPCEHCKGRCGPHCPVRPGVYGFYGTQWRQWPGQDFMSSRELPAATPIQPPRMSVPGPDEESMRPRTEDVVVPLPQPPVESEAFPLPVEPEPEPEPKPVPEPKSPPRTLPPPPAPLPETPSSIAPEDENLFNTRYRPKSLGKLSIGLGSTKPRDAEGAIRSANHLTPSGRPSVPRVPFDPAGEVRELRIRIK